MDERITLLVANAGGTGAASALPLLCRMLAEKGILNASEIEKLRHAALFGFDHAREHKELSPEESELLEQARGNADSMWQRAAMAAERRG